MGTKRYYWLKLSENFFNSNEMRYLENQENGYAYVVLYIKLMLLGMNTGGELYFNGNKPFNKNTISMVTGFPCSVTEEALTQFLDLGMIEMTDDEVIKLCNYDDVVGSESSSAVRMRRKRETYGEASHCDVQASHCDIEIEKDKDKEKDIDIYKEREEEAPDGVHTHSEINIPSLDEVKEYCRERGG